MRRVPGLVTYDHGLLMLLVNRAGRQYNTPMQLLVVNGYLQHGTTPRAAAFKNTARTAMIDANSNPISRHTVHATRTPSMFTRAYPKRGPEALELCLYTGGWGSVSR